MNYLIKVALFYSYLVLQLIFFLVHSFFFNRSGTKQTMYRRCHSICSQRKPLLNGWWSKL